MSYLNYLGGIMIHTNEYVNTVKDLSTYMFAENDSPACCTEFYLLKGFVNSISGFFDRSSIQFGI
jgi:hypothetical protein